MDNHSSKIGAPCNAVSTDKTYRVSKGNHNLEMLVACQKHLHCERLACHVNEKVVAKTPLNGNVNLCKHAAILSNIPKHYHHTLLGEPERAPHICGL